jgi:hypothetical protein
MNFCPSEGPANRGTLSRDRIGEASLADVLGCFFLALSGTVLIYPALRNPDAEHTGIPGLVIEGLYRQFICSRKCYMVVLTYMGCLDIFVCAD